MSAPLDVVLWPGRAERLEALLRSTPHRLHAEPVPGAALVIACGGPGIALESPAAPPAGEAAPLWAIARVAPSAAEVAALLERGACDVLDLVAADLEARLAILLRRAEIARAARLERARLAARNAQLGERLDQAVRTPLHGLLTALERLAASPLDDGQREHLEVLDRAAEALRGALDDLVGFSALEAGRLVARVEPFELRAVCEDVGRLHAPAAHRKGVSLVVDLTPSAPGFVRGDAERLRQIASALVDNAVRYTPSGEVTLHAAAGERALVVEVRDTGVGLAPEALAELFSPGQAVGAPGGRGALGLLVAHQLAAHLGGELSAQSALGQGSTFRLALPWPASRPPAPRAELAAARVLVVSPRPATAGALVRLLEAELQRAEHVSDPREAAAALRAARRFGGGFAVVLLDEDTVGAPEREALTQAAEGARIVGFGVRATLSTPVTQAALVAALRPVQRPRRVLVVDDSLVNRQVLLDLLERLELPGDEACDGAEAVAMIAQGAHGLVLMDCQMPGLDGLEAARRVRASGDRRTAIVALTGSTQAADRERCLEAGMDDHVPKPLGLDGLRELVARYLDAG